MLERENAELRTDNEALRQQVTDQDERIARLEAQLRKLTGSSDPQREAERRKMKAGPSRPATPSGRKPGGQPGHPRHERPEVPPDQVGERQDCVPKRCEKCSSRLWGRDRNPQRHQVFHLPEIKPWVIEYLLHALSCWRCGHVTRASLPAGVPRGAFGASVVAVASLLMGAYRVSKRDVQQLMLDLFAMPMSLGAVVGCQKLASDAVAQPVQQAEDHAVRQRVKHADETSWREKRHWVWLWTLATKTVVVFKIQKRRTADAARRLLRRARGILVTDRAGAYLWWTPWLRQVCWAHLLRDFGKIAARGGDSARIGRELMALTELMFQWWHRVRDGTMKRSTFQRKLAGADGLKAKVHALLLEGSNGRQLKTARTCAKMLQAWPAFWTFAEHLGVEPTNNDAERALRRGVLWRNTSLGTQSEAGSRFVERMLTVNATLRRQQRNVLAFLREAVEAHLAGSQSPSLLPIAEPHHHAVRLRPAV